MHIKKICPIVLTDQLAAVKTFYTTLLGFTVTFDCASYLGLRAGGGGDELSFMPAEEGQANFGGQGLTICFEVEDVDAEAARLEAAGLKVVRPLQDNPWGDRSFVVLDPIGVAVYIYRVIEMCDEFKQHAKE